MGNPTIFSGKRTKLLTTKGVLNSDTSINDNDGVLNYIKNGHAEVNALGWATYKDVAGILPVDGTGGTPTHITFTQTSTAPLGGLGSFLVTNSGSTSAQGEGASYDFTIDTKDKAKVLQINFDYLVNSGTFVAGSSTVDSDLEVYIYDVTNALIIQPSSYKLLSNSTTLTDKFSATFQTASNSTSYRLILHCPTTATAAWSIKLDNVCVCPSQYVYGSPVTDWQTFTPTGTWTTNTTYLGSWRRVGDSLQMQYVITLSGTPNATTLSINLPVGFTIDSNKINLNQFKNTYGYSLGFHAAAGYNFLPLTNNSTSVAISYSTTVNSAQALVSSTAPFTWVSGDTITGTIQVPILGWSSSVQMSDSADTRVVAMSAYKSTTQALTTLVETAITSFNSATIDTHGTFNSTTGLYTIPVSGIYKITANTAFETNSLGYRYNSISKNGSVYQFGNIVNAVTTDGNLITASAIIQCVVGDTIGQKAYQNSGGNLNIRALAGTTSLHIERLTGPSAIAATETVSSSYTLSASFSASTTIPINFDTRDWDYFGSIVTSATAWKFTAPISGIYLVNGQVYSGGSATVADYSIYKMGSPYKSLGASLSGGARAVFSNTAKLNAGEYIDIRPSLACVVASGNVSVTRIGN